MLAAKKLSPPFIPSLNESYFDNDYLNKHISENPENYFNLPEQGKYSKANWPKDQVYCGYSFHNPAEESYSFGFSP